MKESVQYKACAKNGTPLVPKFLSPVFQKAGLRLTRQRLAIYRELCERSDHPNVEQLHRAVKARIPGISLFTVYRTMNAMEDAGIITRVATWKGHARYDGDMNSHAHFLCKTCGKIDSLPPEAISLPEQLVEAQGRDVSRLDLMLSGECAACAAARAAGKREA